MICPTCRRNVGTEDGKIVRHTPLMRVPGRKYCPMSGKPAPETATR
jgi:hypothetical protein